MENSANGQGSRMRGEERHKEKALRIKPERFFNAEGGIRTPTGIHPLRPERSASTRFHHFGKEARLFPVRCLIK